MSNMPEEIIDLKGWTPITQEMPPIGELIQSCFRIDGEFDGVQYGEFTGEMTDSGKFCVIEWAGDWFPCEFWMRLPETPTIASEQNGEHHAR